MYHDMMDNDETKDTISIMNIHNVVLLCSINRYQPHFTDTTFCKRFSITIFKRIEKIIIQRDQNTIHYQHNRAMISINVMFKISLLIIMIILVCISNNCNVMDTIKSFYSSQSTKPKEDTQNIQLQGLASPDSNCQYVNVAYYNRYHPESVYRWPCNVGYNHGCNPQIGWICKQDGDNPEWGICRYNEPRNVKGLVCHQHCDCGDNGLTCDVDNKCHGNGVTGWGCYDNWDCKWSYYCHDKLVNGQVTYNNGEKIRECRKRNRFEPCLQDQDCIHGLLCAPCTRRNIWSNLCLQRFDGNDHC